MASVNKVILVAHLGRDPEMRYSANGDAVANVTVATTDRWKDKTTGEQKEQTEWTRVVFYRRLAEVVCEYLKKGSQVYLEGKLQTRKWTDKAGVERYTTEVIADTMQMLGGVPAGANQRSQDDGATARTPAQPPVATPVAGMLDADDIPF